jgi:hypothetical protein
MPTSLTKIEKEKKTKDFGLLGSFYEHYGALPLS